MEDGPNIGNIPDGFIFFLTGKAELAVPWRQIKCCMRISVFILFLALFFQTGCTTDFDLEAPWKDVPIVYGFLSVQDTAHYIRVEKAFLEPDGDARQIARIPDSIYYDEDVSVFLEKITSGRIYALSRVEANEEGYPRAEGPFVEDPNILYKISADNLSLRAGDRIRLGIDRGSDLPIVTAETIVLDDITIRESNPVSPVNMSYDRNINFVFNVGEAARLFDVRLQLKIREERSGQIEDNIIEWILAKDLENVSSEGRVSVSITGEEFYRFLGGALSTESGLRRTFRGFDVLISAGGQEMVDLLKVQNANLGITSSQSIPAFTNLSEGLGIFTSRSTAVRPDLQITSVSFDSLRNGKFTKDLGF